MSVKRIATDRGSIALRNWWQRTPPAEVKAACERAGIRYEHFKNVAAGRRRFSIEAAAVFVEASQGTLGLSQLLPLQVNRRNGN